MIVHNGIVYNRQNVESIQISSCECTNCGTFKQWHTIQRHEGADTCFNQNKPQKPYAVRKVRWKRRHIPFTTWNLQKKQERWNVDKKLPGAGNGCKWAGDASLGWRLVWKLGCGDGFINLQIYYKSLNCTVKRWTLWYVIPQKGIKIKNWEL